MVEKFSIFVKDAIELDMMQKYLKDNGWKISNLDGFTPQIIICESSSMLVSYETNKQIWWNKQLTSTHNFGGLLEFDKDEDYNKIKELVYRNTDLKGFARLRQLVRCCLVGDHIFTSPAIRGEKMKLTGVANHDLDFREYTKSCCKYCGLWKD